MIFAEHLHVKFHENLNFTFREIKTTATNEHQQTRVVSVPPVIGDNLF